MNGPFYFSGRRWVSTKDLKDMRLGARSGEDALFGDDRLGSYLALYWTPKGRFRDNTDWSTRQVHWLHANGRMFAERDHIHTLLYIYKGADARDADGVPPELALDHPFRGLGAVIVEPGRRRRRRPAPPRPCRPPGPSRWSCRFRGVPLPPDAPVSQPGTDGADRRELQLWFADAEPAGWWAGGGRLRRRGRRVGRRPGPLGVALHPHRPRHRPLHRPALVALRGGPSSPAAGPAGEEDRDLAHSGRSRGLRGRPRLVHGLDREPVRHERVEVGGQRAVVVAGAPNPRRVR